VKIWGHDSAKSGRNELDLVSVYESRGHLGSQHGGSNPGGERPWQIAGSQTSNLGRFPHRSRRPPTLIPNRKGKAKGRKAACAAPLVNPDSGEKNHIIGEGASKNSCGKKRRFGECHYCGPDQPSRSKRRIQPPPRTRPIRSCILTCRLNGAANPSKQALCEGKWRHRQAR